MDQRVAFIAEWLREKWTMTELAARHGISCKTAYKWVDRHEADPATGLADQSQAPHQHGRAMAPAVAAAVLAPAAAELGAKMLRAVLQRREPATAWPAASTIGDLVRRSAQCAAAAHALDGGADAALGRGHRAQRCPGHDFKGWFRTQTARAATRSR